MLKIIMQLNATLDVERSNDYFKTMAIRDIITVPDRRLKIISDPVEAVSEDVRLILDDMLETMYHANGIGLAAIQVGVSKRLIVMDISDRDGDVDPEDGEVNLETGPRYFVNPEIIWVSEETNNYQEGCLSVPSFYDDVERPKQCKVKYLDYDGVETTIDCDGLLATCIQHEMDHLNGVVFLDHLSRLKRDRVLKKIQKEAKAELVG
jgi:peptide deformylase